MRDNARIKVCVAGLGNVGLPSAKYIADKGFEVYGYDVSERAVKNAENQGIRASQKWDGIPLADIYVICVPVLLSEDRPDLSPLVDVSEKIVLQAEKATMVSVESTVPPGSCRRLYEEVFIRSVRLIHVPHRYWSGDPVRHGVRQKRVLGGINEGSLKAGVEFYKEGLDIPLHVVPVIEIAEMSKVSENAYRYVQIAFAEELRMICEKVGLNFEEVRKACNTKWNIEILEARDGIGGHCLPKDIRYVISLDNSCGLLKSALGVDKKYREWLSTRMGVVKSANYPLRRSK